MTQDDGTDNQNNFPGLDEPVSSAEQRKIHTQGGSYFDNSTLKNTGGINVFGGNVTITVSDGESKLVLTSEKLRVAARQYLEKLLEPAPVDGLEMERWLDAPRCGLHP